MSPRVVLMAWIGLTAACGGDPGSADPAISLERRVSDGADSSCFRPCEGSDPPPEAAPDRCIVDTDQGATRCDDLAGGVDVLRVAIGYGVVTLDDTANLAAVEAEMVGDNATIQTKSLRAGDLRTGDRELYFAGEFTAPAKRVETLEFAITLPDGGILHSEAAAVQAPSVSLTAAGCDDSDCSRTAQVGELVLTLAVSADTGATAGSIASYVDDELVGTPIEVPLNAAEGSRREGTRRMNVPAGDSWTLVGRVGTLQPDIVDVALVAPAIGARIQECPETGDCDVEAGAAISVLVTAPRDTNATAGSLRVYVGGVLTADAIPAPLQACGAEQVCAVVPVNVPDQVGKTWRAVATVGEYDAATTSPMIIAAP